ncbi:hypothetical protein YC2023_049953 [Brassica napus]
MEEGTKYLDALNWETNKERADTPIDYHNHIHNQYLQNGNYKTEVVSVKHNKRTRGEKGRTDAIGDFLKTTTKLVSSPEVHVSGGFDRRSFLFSIWRKPNRVLLSPHHLRSPGFSQRRISPMILFGDISSLMRFRRALGVRLFSQREYHSPVLEFLVLWSYSIDGLSLQSLQSLQVDIIIRGSCLVQIRNRQKLPPWPGDFKRWMRVIHEELETWCIIIGLYFWWFMSYRQLLLILFILKAFLQDPVVLMIKNKIQRSEWGSVRFKARSLKISQQTKRFEVIALFTTRKHAEFRRRFRRTSVSSDICDGLPTNFRPNPKN